MPDHICDAMSLSPWGFVGLLLTLFLFKLFEMNTSESLLLLSSESVVLHVVEVSTDGGYLKTCPSPRAEGEE